MLAGCMSAVFFTTHAFSSWFFFTESQTEGNYSPSFSELEWSCVFFLFIFIQGWHKEWWECCQVDPICWRHACHFLSFFLSFFFFNIYWLIITGMTQKQPNGREVEGTVWVGTENSETFHVLFRRPLSQYLNTFTIQADHGVSPPKSFYRS